MGTSRLELYNAALLLCGTARLAALTDEVEGRYLLDLVWDGEGVRKVLEAGLWNFAIRSQKLTPNSSVTTDFGYTNAFDKGSDWVRTVAICNDEFFESPLLQYDDEGQDYLFADVEEVYVKYVSDNASYGGDLSKWPGSFQEYAEAFFASKVINRLAADKDRILFLLGHPNYPRTGHLEKAIKNARAKDAMKDSTKFFPAGSWVSARGRGRGGGPFGDRGSGGALTG
jgi:hypothetical protein